MAENGGIAKEMTLQPQRKQPVISSEKLARRRKRRLRNENVCGGYNQS
jgi:hypothetical protein